MSGWSDGAYEVIARIVEARTGLTFSGGRQADAESGIRRALKRSGLPSIHGYVARLALEPRTFDELIDELTVHETYFFREASHFDFVRREILGTPERRRLGCRAWSAGCASGEEPYSLAILFEEEGISGDVSILATDISRAALSRAASGVYRPWSFRGVPPSTMDRWFERDGEQRRVLPNIRDRVSFEHMNLALDVFPSFVTRTMGLDLIFCRNVLIYLDKETIRRIAGRFYESLMPGGWLIPGASDPPLGELAPFETIVTPFGLVYRRPLPAYDATSTFVGADAALDEPLPRAVGRPSWLKRLTTSDRAPVDVDADPVRSACRVRALANEVGIEAAAEHCRAALAVHQLSAELHFLAAVLAIALGNDDAALASLRRAIYLDRTLAIAHYTLGSLHQRSGELVAARRAYRNARDLCRERPDEELLPLGEGEHAGTLAREAEHQLAVIDDLLGRSAEDE